jgi:hypothetical protein
MNVTFNGSYTSLSPGTYKSTNGVGYTISEVDTPGKLIS